MASHFNTLERYLAASFAALCGIDVSLRHVQLTGCVLTCQTLEFGTGCRADDQFTVYAVQSQVGAIHFSG